MKIDGIVLTDGADIENLVVAKGPTFPNASEGELFYFTGTPGAGLYIFNGSNWTPTGVDAYTRAETDARIQAVIGTAPSALDTLGEIATQMQNDETGVASIVSTLALKADKTYVDTGLASKVNTSSLATVATSGNYNDLSNLPTPYSLPTASSSVLGGVKVDGSTITISNGVISASQSSSYILPTASASTLGGVKVDGSTILISNGVISVPNTAIPYDIASNAAGLPGAGATIMMVAISRAMTLASGLANSVAKAGTGATAQAVFTLNKNGTNVGTLTFTAGATTGTFASSSQISLAAGDVLTLIAPSTQDATLADIAWTLNGYLA
jgi:hypothetical protein